MYGVFLRIFILFISYSFGGAKLYSQSTTCYTNDIAFKNKKYINPNIHKNVNLDTIRVYVEISYSLYGYSGESYSTCSNWLNRVFDQVTLIFGIHNIPIKLQKFHVWTTVDPYAAVSSTITQKLSHFGMLQQNDFDGHIALFLNHGNPSGYANLDKLCVGYNAVDHTGPYAVINVPNFEYGNGFSYNTNSHLVSHELGHIIGSRHTHACVWGANGNDSLDNCYIPEGNCNTGQTPFDGGTIMSYCDRYPQVGVNFRNGFGPEPGNLLSTIVSSAPCLYSCDYGSPCDDGDPCTTNDLIDTNCLCLGNLIDTNTNGICDLSEPCEEYINADTVTVNTVIAKMAISASEHQRHINTLYMAGNEIMLFPGFEIVKNKAFEIKMEGCN